MAYPFANQKKILKIEAISRMAQTSEEKVPSDFYFFMSLSWET
jgi:hypothetical protein